MRGWGRARRASTGFARRAFKGSAVGQAINLLSSGEKIKDKEAVALVRELLTGDGDDSVLARLDRIEEHLNLKETDDGTAGESD